MPNKPTSAPPPHLSARAQQLWTHYARTDKGNAWLALFRVALESLDRSDQASAIVLRDGLTVTTARSGVAHVNPAIRIEKDARGQFAAIWHQLGLDTTERHSFARQFGAPGSEFE